MACGEPKFCTNCIEGVRKLLGVHKNWGGMTFHLPNRFSEHTKIEASKESLHQGIDEIIKRLNGIKEKITDQNCDKFNILVSENRDLDPVQDPESMLAVGFVQISPVYLDIRIEDHRKAGETL